MQVPAPTLLPQQHMLFWTYLSDLITCRWFVINICFGKQSLTPLQPKESQREPESSSSWAPQYWKIKTQPSRKREGSNVGKSWLLKEVILIFSLWWKVCMCDCQCSSSGWDWHKVGSITVCNSHAPVCAKYVFNMVFIARSEDLSPRLDGAFAVDA